MLEDASNNTSEENQMLVQKIDELDSRLQALEAKCAPSEASMIEKAKVMHCILVAVLNCSIMAACLTF
jgi:hypothetical protein